MYSRKEDDLRGKQEKEQSKAVDEKSFSLRIILYKAQRTCTKASSIVQYRLEKENGLK